MTARELVREQMARGDGTELPAQVSNDIIARLTIDEQAALLPEVLPTFVSLVFGEERRHPHGGGTRSGGGRSTKAARIRAHYDQVFEGRIHVGTNAYKPLKLCNYDDLTYAARERHEQGTLNFQWRDRFNTYATLLKTNEVDIVDELPKAAKDAIYFDYERTPASTTS